MKARIVWNSFNGGMEMDDFDNMGRNEVFIGNFNDDNLIENVPDEELLLPNFINIQRNNQNNRMFERWNKGLYDLFLKKIKEGESKEKGRSGKKDKGN